MLAIAGLGGASVLDPRGPTTKGNPLIGTTRGRRHEQALESHTSYVPMRWRATVLLLAAATLYGCGADDHEPPDTGLVVVTVTLSRSGPPGPKFNHVPQGGVDVTVADGSGGTWSGKTGESGEARRSVPAGEYEVDTSYCPQTPQHVTVTAGETTNTRFDCLAA
jgi:hypothetical protein